MPLDNTLGFGDTGEGGGSPAEFMMFVRSSIVSTILPRNILYTSPSAGSVSMRSLIIMNSVRIA